MNEFCEARKRDNERLLGKTIYWRKDGEDYVGVSTGVKDHETILVVTPDKVTHEVDLFDIYRTSR
jgi:hypothetical protein